MTQTNSSPQPKQIARDENGTQNPEIAGGSFDEKAAGIAHRRQQRLKARHDRLSQIK